jgi:hypothetical protein
MMLIALAAAALQLANPLDLMKPGEETAFTQGVLGAVVQIAQMRHGGPCPATTGVDFNGARRIGTAGVLLSAGPTDAVAPEAMVYDQKVHVRGCGDQARWDNILVVRKKAGGWIFAPTAPGDTFATPQLFHDTLLQTLALASVGKPPGSRCDNGRKSYELIDTLVVGPPPGSDASKLQTWFSKRAARIAACS